MAKLPDNFQESPTVLAIYESYEKASKQRRSRRLGASVLGKECPRAIWYSFRWALQETFSGRMLRLFETGSREEPRFVANLKAIGCEVVELDPETNSQIEYVGVHGHVVSKLDAVLLNLPEAPKTWHACEFKTHNAKSFAELRNKGLKKAKPEHYAQLVIGMALANLTRGLYLAQNKDTDELYSERIRIEEASATEILDFAKTIVVANRAPEKIADDAEKLPCKFCAFRFVCHGSVPPAAAVVANVNCRTCCHATPEIETNTGGWKCERHQKALSMPEQERGCEDHLFIPDFVTFAQPADGGNDDEGNGFVEYQKPDGQIFRNGKSNKSYRSIELTQLPHPLVAGEPLIDAVKELGATVVEVQ